MKFKRIILALLFSSLCMTSNATHIVGGSMSLKWVSGNTYILTLKVLRDCINAQAPFDGQGLGGSPCTVGMFDLANNSNKQYIDMGSPTVKQLVIEGPNCAGAAPNVCTELGVYKKTLTFSPATYKSSAGYYFAYERCCRNSIIQNISVPGDAAIAVYMEVPPFAIHNSTPEFTNNPFTFLCVDNPFKYNFDFIEPDGDSLHYSMVTPLNGFSDKTLPSTTTPLAGPYPTITWLPNYDDAHQVRGNPPLNIDPDSGDVTMTPVEAGVYVAAFRVEEFRFGQKLGEVRLELQFSVTNCLSNPFPKVVFRNSDGSFSNGKYTVQIPNKLCFDINISDISDSLFIKIGGKIFTNPLITQKPIIDTPFQLSNNLYLDTTRFGVTVNKAAHFCWQTDCSLTGIADQTFDVNVVDNGCPLPKTTKSTFTIHVDSMPSTKPQIKYRDQFGTIDSIGNFFKHIRIPDNLCFDILADHPSDTFQVEITGEALKNTLYRKRPTLSAGTVFTSFLHGESKFCWSTDCSLMGSPVHEFNVKVTDNAGCFPVVDSSTFYIIIDSMPLVNPPDLLCVTLSTDNQTNVDFGDSTTHDPYYFDYHIYRAYNNDPFTLYDSITSRVVKGTFIDWNSIDNKTNNYQYYIRAVNFCGIEGPTSDTAQTLSNTKPTPEIQKLLTVTVEENSYLKIVWPVTWENDFARYFLYRTKNDGSTNFISVADFHNKNDTVFYDRNVDVHSQSYCYYLVMKDTCQNYGPMGQLSCSILLEGVASPFVNQMHWSPYTYWDNGTKSYSIYKEDNLTPFDKLAENGTSELKLTDADLNIKSTGKFNYYVIANQNPPPGTSGSQGSQVALLNSKSNEIELAQAPMLYVPNAYTPNEDGINDDWDLRDVFVKDFELKVYNRWGQLIFTSTDKNKRWHGELAGNLIAPEDVYVYMVSYSGWDGSLHYDKGNVTILR